MDNIFADIPKEMPVKLVVAIIKNRMATNETIKLADEMAAIQSQCKNDNRNSN